MIERKKYFIFCKMVVIAIAVSSCHSFTTSHENFKNIMRNHVGNRVDAPSSYIERYPQDIIGEKTLLNGNREIAYYAGYRNIGDCTVFFEVDSKTQEVVGWRFIGSEESCVIVP